jgi:hypothetical protein
MAMQNAGMRIVFTARHPAEAHLIRGMLEADGIRAVVRNDQLYGAFGEIPVLPTVWIVDDSEADCSSELIVGFLCGSAARAHGYERWTCVHCGEVLEGQFTDCWNCGSSRPQIT